MNFLQSRRRRLLPTTTTPTENDAAFATMGAARQDDDEDGNDVAMRNDGIVLDGGITTVAAPPPPTTTTTTNDRQQGLRNRTLAGGGGIVMSTNGSSRRRDTDSVTIIPPLRRTRRRRRSRLDDGGRSSSMWSIILDVPTALSYQFPPNSRYMVCGVTVFCLLQVWIWFFIDSMDTSFNNTDDGGVDAFNAVVANAQADDDDRVEDDTDDNSNNPIDVLLRRLHLKDHHHRRLGTKFVAGTLILELLTCLINIVAYCVETMFGISIIPGDDHGELLQKYETEYFTEQHLKPVLLIGGTDGSGTRAVVDLLRELGAMVVADDKETFDVHANMLYKGKGWPGLVRTVLKQTHGKVNYNYDQSAAMKDDPVMTNLTKIQFDPFVRSKIDDEVKRNLLFELRSKFDFDKALYRRQYAVRKLVEEQQLAGVGVKSFRSDQLWPHERRGHKNFRRGPPLPATLRQGGMNGRTTIFPGLAMDISYVIKAPVSMLLWPVLAQHLASPHDQRIKILHVIRDGRDIALSNNQSPVIKFFNITYPSEYTELLRIYSDELEPVRGMKLWSDWNTQARQWATSYASVKEASVKIEYLWIRSEDLLPGSLQRRQALQALAEFVGSTLSNDQLCCLSQQKARDYGKSVVHNAQTFEEEQHLDKKRHKTRYNNVVDRWKELERNRRKKLRSPSSGGRDYGGDLDRIVNLHHTQRRLLQQERRETNQGGRHTHVDFGSWKMLAEKLMGEDVQGAKVFAIEALIQNGRSLLSEWKEDKELFLEKGISKKEIIEIIDNLRVLKEEVRALNFQDVQSGRQGDVIVTKRFGKWRTVFENHTNANLAAHMYDVGSHGLQMFGYHPERLIHYPTKIMTDDTSPCTSSSSISCPSAT